MTYFSGHMHFKPLCITEREAGGAQPSISFACEWNLIFIAKRMKDSLAKGNLDMVHWKTNENKAMNHSTIKIQMK